MRLLVEKTLKGIIQCSHCLCILIRVCVVPIQVAIFCKDRFVVLVLRTSLTFSQQLVPVKQRLYVGCSFKVQSSYNFKTPPHVSESLDKGNDRREGRLDQQILLLYIAIYCEFSVRYTCLKNGVAFFPIKHITSGNRHSPSA